MDNDSKMAVMANDLDSMRHRIEALPGHVKMTEALNHVSDAAKLVTEARSDIHQAEMKKRFR